jgi:exopolyphosphatase/pppGpp-phosphohydrolase
MDVRSPARRLTSPSRLRAPAAALRAHPKFARIYQLAEQCQYDADHAHQVMRLALLLFDATAPLHELGRRERTQLAAAALLHDIGRVEGSRRHHHTSMRLILESSLLTWKHRKRLVVGSVARYHRRALPSVKHGHFRELAEADRDIVCTLSALLRVADGLDRRHRQSIDDLDIDITRRGVHLTCHAHLPAVAERRAALRKADLFTIVFNRELTIDCPAAVLAA